MLGDKTVTATIAVKDVGEARKFYEGILGLKEDKSDPGGVLYKSGTGHVYVYSSAVPGTSQSTSASWGVGDDFDKVVEDLKSKDITFEHYDMPGISREGDVHVMDTPKGQLKSAWFKDPDGNILNIVNAM